MHDLVTTERGPLTQEAAEKMADSLSVKELDVAWLVTLGKRTTVIAQQLRISRRTLDVHLRSIRIKFGMVPTYGIPLILLRSKGFTWPKNLE